MKRLITYFKKPISASASASGAGTKQELAAVLFFFFAAFSSTFLLAASRFWDDWTMFYLDSPLRLEWFQMTGNHVFGHLNNLIYSLPHPGIIYFFISTLSLAGALIFLWLSLTSITAISRGQRIFITAFFTVFPVYFARACQISAFNRNLPCLLFFLGLYLTIQSFNKKKTSLRIISLATLMMSFFLYSLLTFYLVVLIYLIYQHLEKTKARPSLFSWLAYTDYLALPLVFWTLRQIFFRPTGMFEESNHPSLAFLTWPNIWEAVHVNLIEVYQKYVFGTFAAHPWLVILLSVLIFAILNRVITGSSRRVSKSDVVFLGIGIIAFFAALLPYILINKIPSNSGWLSRYQVLLPLGGGMITYYTCRIILCLVRAPRAAALAVFAILLSTMIISHNRMYLALHRESLKHQALIEHFRDNEQIKELTNELFLVYDPHGKHSKILELYVPFTWEYIGMLKAAFSDTRRVATSILIPSPGALLIDKTINWRFIFWSGIQAKFSATPYVVMMNSSRIKDVDLIQQLNLAGHSLVRKEQFKTSLKKLIDVYVVPWKIFKGIMQQYNSGNDNSPVTPMP